MLTQGKPAVASGLMQSVTHGLTPRPPRAIIYGTQGVGKSTFAASAPDPVFVQVEDGLGQIDTAKFPLARSVKDVIDQLTAVRDEPHNFQTLVIDSLDWLERLIWDKVCKDWSVNSIEKVDKGYGKGYVYALTEWRQIVSLLDEIRDRRSMMILCLAHAKTEKFEDPEQGIYDRWSPRLHKSANALFYDWADMILFASSQFTVTDKGKAQAVGVNGGKRVLRAIGGPAVIAKNRYDMPMELPLVKPNGWKVVSDAIFKDKE